MEGEVGEDATETEEGEEDEDGYHDDDVVTDAGADVEPAAVVFDEEEEMLEENEPHPSHCPSRHQVEI